MVVMVVVVDAERGCTVQVSSSRGPTYVPSTSPGSLLCGTVAEPWIVDAEPGQHLEVSVVDFAAADPEGDNEVPPSCPGYLFDSDASGVGRRNVSLCPDGRQRERYVYKSVSHVVELITIPDMATAVTSSEEQPAPATFLVRFDGQQLHFFLIYALCVYETS